jgi:hypothetical protein
LGYGNVDDLREYAKIISVAIVTLVAIPVVETVTASA